MSLFEEPNPLFWSVSKPPCSSSQRGCGADFGRSFAELKRRGTSLLSASSQFGTPSVLECLVFFPPKAQSMAKGSSVGFMEVIMRVIAKRVIAQRHSTESFAQSHCTESLHRESLARAMLVRVTGEEQRESHWQGAMLTRVLMRVLNSFLLFLGRRGRADSTLRKSTFCGDRRGRCKKTEDIYDFCGARTTLCGDPRGRF